MAKLWSISTTIRNPKRIKEFLKVLKELEGKKWNEETQIQYQILLIAYKVYKPNKYKKYIKENDISYEKAEKIFKAVNYKDPAMRGRQSINLLKKLGLADIDKNGLVIITSDGIRLINDEISIGDLLINMNFDTICDVDVNPIITTLEFLYILYCKMYKSSKGIKKKEFIYYVMTIQKWNDVEKYVDYLLKSRDDKKFKQEYEKIIERTYENFKHVDDYFDSIIRYFLVSDLINVNKVKKKRKKKYNLNIDENKIKVIKNIIEKYHKEKENY